MGNLHPSVQKFQKAVAAKAAADAQLRDAFTVTAVAGSVLTVARTGRKDFAVFTAEGAFVAGMSPETLMTIGPVSIELGFPMPIGSAFLGAEAIQTMIDQI